MTNIYEVPKPEEIFFESMTKYDQEVLKRIGPEAHDEILDAVEDSFPVGLLREAFIIGYMHLTIKKAKVTDRDKIIEYLKSIGTILSHKGGKKEWET